MVIDASIPVAVILNEPEKAEILRLTTGANLVSPGCLPWEVGNAFSAMMKRDRLAIRVALDCWGLFELMRVRYVRVDFGNSLRIAGENSMYAYDAYYLDCAQRLGLPLLTLDRKLRGAAVRLRLDAPEVKR